MNDNLRDVFEDNAVERAEAVVGESIGRERGVEGVAVAEARLHETQQLEIEEGQNEHGGDYGSILAHPRRKTVIVEVLLEQEDDEQEVDAESDSQGHDCSDVVRVQPVVDVRADVENEENFCGPIESRDKESHGLLGKEIRPFCGSAKSQSEEKTETHGAYIMS